MYVHKYMHVQYIFTLRNAKGEIFIFIFFFIAFHMPTSIGMKKMDIIDE